MRRINKLSFAAITLIFAACSAVPASAEDTPSRPSVGAPQNGAVIRLWETDAPGSVGHEDADIPTLTIYHSATPNGAAVVVCPGGGYGGLAFHEGKPVAEWLNTVGVTGFVLKYRLGPRYHHPVMMQDVNRAIRMVRAHAAEWQIDPKRIGVLGFSAGGHLASTAATHFDDGHADASDPIDRVSSRPDIAVLIYPVITMGSFTHGGSKQNLLGNDPAPDLVDLMSNEKQVTDKTPPCFLVHGIDDSAVPVENSIAFMQACRTHHVPVELHLIAHGPHGFGLGPADQPDTQWPATCANWMKYLGFLKAAK